MIKKTTVDNLSTFVRYMECIEYEQSVPDTVQYVKLYGSIGKKK